MRTLAFDFPAALEVAAELVFLLIILFGELLRCKKGLFCTVPPVLGPAFFSGEAAVVEDVACCCTKICFDEFFYQ